MADTQPYAGWLASKLQQCSQRRRAIEAGPAIHLLFRELNESNSLVTYTEVISY